MKKILCIIVDKYLLPYTIQYIAENIQKDYDVPARVTIKSIERLENIKILYTLKGHVFVPYQEDSIQKLNDIMNDESKEN